jgi:hypothetical protein
MQLLVEETNIYYHQYWHILDTRCCPLPAHEMHLYLAIIFRWDMTKETIQTLLVHTRTICMAFYGNTMKQDRFFHILEFLHFSDNKNELHKTDENYDRLWEMKPISEQLK